MVTQPSSASRFSRLAFFHAFTCRRKFAALDGSEQRQVHVMRQSATIEKSSGKETMMPTRRRFLGHASAASAYAWGNQIHAAEFGSGIFRVHLPIHGSLMGGSLCNSFGPPSLSRTVSRSSRRHGPSVSFPLPQERPRRGPRCLQPRNL
jgi:hypothetical protein